MKYQISWEAFLMVSAACLLVYYGVVLILCGMRKPRRLEVPIPPTLDKLTTSGVEVKNEKPAQLQSTKPLIPQSILSMVTTLMIEILEGAVVQKISKMRFLELLHERLSSFLEVDNPALTNNIRGFLRYGSASIGLPLSATEIDTALGIHEASP